MTTDAKFKRYLMQFVLAQILFNLVIVIWLFLH